MREINRNGVTRFIKHDLVDKLDADFARPPFRIFREQDLHAACYHHLRRHLRSHRDWEICNEPYIRDLKGRGKGGYPDLVIFYRRRPVALIELKFRRRGLGIQGKDQKVLRRAVKGGKWTSKAFYIEVVVQPRKKLRPGRPRRIRKYRNHVHSVLMHPEHLAAFRAIFKERRRLQPRRRPRPKR